MNFSPCMKLLFLLSTKLIISKKENGHKLTFLNVQLIKSIEKFDTEYKSVAKDIYNEYWLRNHSNKLKGLSESELRDRMDLAWETYTSIFEREVFRVNFHPIMIWVITV